VCLECDAGELPPVACPACQGDRLVEWDAVLRVLVCGVCSHQWRPRHVARAVDALAPVAMTAPVTLQSSCEPKG